MKLEGIHHITAITGDAPGNVDFYTRVLGLRLVAKTVNQDQPDVYHLFFASETGKPGSELTFFEYPGAIPGQPGEGMVHRIVSRVGSPEALDFWAQRLGDLDVPAERTEGSVRFADPEGLAHELVVSTVDEPLVAQHPDIPEAYALGGFASVRAYSGRPERSAALLERVLGATPAGDATWELRGERRGSTIAYDPSPGLGRQAAAAVPSALQDLLAALGGGGHRYGNSLTPRGRETSPTRPSEPADLAAASSAPRSPPAATRGTAAG